MTLFTFEPGQTPQATPLGEKSRLLSRRDLTWVLVMIPTVLHLFGLWVIRPFPLAYATTFMLSFTILLVQVPREYALNQARKLTVEFTLLLALILLASLSIINSNDPVRCFRVIYPAVIPFILFLHYIAVGGNTGNRLLWAPRILVGMAFLMSTAPLLASFVLPPVKSFIFDVYRVRGFFENAIQHTIVLAAAFPILVGELAISRKRWLQLALGILTLIYLYTMFRAGSKMAMATSVGITSLMFIVMRLRNQSPIKTLMMFGAFIGAALFLVQFGLPIAEKLSPELAEKIESVIRSKGSYHSIQSRQLLWDEAIRQGNRHWLIGSGAGEKVLGVSHAHNLVLDYYKGTGLFGAVAITCLCLAVIFRTTAKGIQMLGGPASSIDKRVFACYTGATVYVICNQLSDCFGPSTIGFLWTIYLAGVICDNRPSLMPLMKR